MEPTRFKGTIAARYDDPNAATGDLVKSLTGNQKSLAGIPIHPDSFRDQVMYPNFGKCQTPKGDRYYILIAVDCPLSEIAGKPKIYKFPGLWPLEVANLLAAGSTLEKLEAEHAPKHPKCKPRNAPPPAPRNPKAK